VVIHTAMARWRSPVPFRAKKAEKPQPEKVDIFERVKLYQECLRKLREQGATPEDGGGKRSPLPAPSDDGHDFPFLGRG
jgi:hypothetical protein